jgi:hypothetical protein
LEFRDVTLRKMAPGALNLKTHLKLALLKMKKTPAHEVEINTVISAQLKNEIQQYIYIVRGGTELAAVLLST